MGFQPFSPNDPTRTHDATLSLVAADDGASTYRVKLWSCQAPTCYCSNMVLECTPDSDAHPADPSRHPAEPRACCLNVVARRPVYLDTTSPDEHQFGDAVVAALTDADWIWLSEYFRASKRKLFENLDIDTCDVRFPPDIQIEPGRMLGYGELFPWAESWVFSHENHSWILEDCYCTLPDCDCSNALLEFFPVPPADVLETTDEQTPVEPVAGLWLNLKSGRTAEPFKTAGHPSPHALLKSVRASQPDLDRRLQRRANHIHRLADRLLPRPDTTLAPSSTFIRTSPKTGRNDPCPCGSGRKFKQCCGKPV